MDKQEIIRRVRERLQETWPTPRGAWGITAPPEAPPEACDLHQIIFRTEVTEWTIPDDMDQYLVAIAAAPPHDDDGEIRARIRGALAAFWDRGIKADPLR